MTESERVIKAWERIENWFSQNMPEAELTPGAPAEEIHKLETHMKLVLPEGLRTSLLRHNGIEEGEWPKGTLLDIEGIKRGWDICIGLVSDGTPADSPGEDVGDEWSPAWIPIDADGAGNGTYIDMNPDENGKVGQVIEMDYELEPTAPLFDGYVEYLEDIASQLEAGKYVNNDGYLEEAL